MVANEKSHRNPYDYMCINCQYKTANKKDYNKHLLTLKHIRLTEANDFLPKNPLTCECGKMYKHKSSLCKHRVKCHVFQTNNLNSMDTEPSDNAANVSIIDSDKLKHTTTNNYQRNENTNEPLNQTELIVELLKQNQEFKNLILEERKEFQDIITEQNKQLNNQNEKMMEMAENMGNNHHNTNNSHNKFNLNVFLNEQCKDAISLTDFVNSMNLSIDDFIQTGELGFVDGISRVMIERINNMELCNRPLHCTDLKREIVYIKDDERWEKDEDKNKLRNAVKNIARENDRIRPLWYDKTPDVDVLGSENCEKFFKYSKAALGGYGKDETKLFEDKIMKNVLKQVTIDKKHLPLK